MAQLKEHMLREIATDLCGRIQPFYFCNNKNVLSNLEKFVLAGKEEFRIFRWIVENDITVTAVTPDRVEVKYLNKLWRHDPSFLDVLMLMWARKLHMDSFQYLYKSPKRGYSKILAENKDFEELRIEGLSNRFNYWPEILKAFPKLVFMRVTVDNFASMLSIASTELACLKEVALIDNSLSSAFIDAHEALLKHQNKLPSLDTIHYIDMSLDEVTFPAGNVLSVKHLKIETNIACFTPFDCSRLRDVQKMYPSLETVQIVVDARCDCRIHQKLKILKSAYRAVESLYLKIPFEFLYFDDIVCYEKDVDRLREFLEEKGKVYESSNKLTAVTVISKTRFTCEVTLEYNSDSEEEDEGEDEDEDDSDDYAFHYGNIGDEFYGWP